MLQFSVHDSLQTPPKYTWLFDDVLVSCTDEESDFSKLDDIYMRFSGKVGGVFMKRFVSALILVVAAISLNSPGLSANETPDEAALRHLKTVLWPQAYRSQDTELLARILDDSFQMIDAEGNRSDKHKELAWLAENTWNPGAFEYRIERLDIYDAMWAIVDGTGIAEKYSYKSSNVLIKRGGQWRAVASHVSGFREVGVDP
jgi:hypothetical protein